MQETLAKPEKKSLFSKRSSTPRLLLLDVLRGWFVLAMIVFHLAWDLSAFGFTPAGMMFTPGWRWFGHSILAGFLAISGFSLFWAWSHQFRAESIVRRFLKIGGAAGLISLSTYMVTPDTFVYFGVLHHIALGSLILAFSRKLPVVVLAALALAAAALPSLLTHSVFNGPWWCWLGLAEVVRPSNDAVPILPWIAYMFGGGIVARLAPRETVLKIGSMGPLASWSKPLAWVGKHSLLIYLFHQPVIWGILYLLARK